ncbi:MAG: 4Fe-4S dicluster domain-containing protein, partial [Candidatus Aenigmarchaeota archaeon]|nr:4Fe-4S dicluster domain-containing protein [Candidatus Aenigmarchaeota archaeon]
MTEEKKPTLKDCTLCGLCKSNCPVFRATKQETKGARARAILIKED